MFKVTFAFEDGSVVEVFANAGDNLLEVARGANVAIDAPCSGNASCGKCRVQLKSGELDTKKTLHISDEEFNEGWRLACVSKICADVTVLVPDIASAYKSRMKVADLSSKEEIAIFENAKREITLTGIELKNSLDVIEVTMDEPSLDDTMPDNERLTRALRKFLNIRRVRIPYKVLKKLPDVLRDNHFQVKCVVITTSEDMYVYDIFGKDQKVTIGGLAVDIGTTTVSAVLIDMDTGEILAKGSAGNGQIRFGADVINRIIESRKPGGQKKIQDAVGYGKYDIVTANILADVLEVLTPVIVAQMKPGAYYITSGILNVKEEVVREAVQKAGLTIEEVTYQGEWVSITARKRG